MKKTLIAAFAALAIPATALAADDTTTTPTPKQAAKASCHAQRDQMGKTLFHQTYGNNGLGKCISAAAKAEKANQTEAKSACQTEQADANFAAGHGGKTFAQTYGTGKNGKNAYGKCVSSKAKAASKADVKAIVNAAKTCKQMKKDSPADFTKKNAFGKCVSAQSKAKNDDQAQS
jgi:hypothetical protein